MWIVIVAALCVAAGFALGSLRQTHAKETAPTSLHVLAPSPAALARANDGAAAGAADAEPPRRRIYFDIGGNSGYSVTTFLERHAAEPGEDWDVIVVEPSPVWTATLTKLCKDIVANRALHARSCLPLVETAITTYDGDITLYIDNILFNGEGSTTVADTAHAGEGEPFVTSALDVVTLFTGIFPVRDDDIVHVKIDIEGAEYGVTSRAVRMGLVPLFDFFTVEWHTDNTFIWNASKFAENLVREQCLQSVIEGRYEPGYDPAKGLKVTFWGGRARQ